MRYLKRRPNESLIVDGRLEVTVLRVDETEVHFAIRPRSTRRQKRLGKLLQSCMQQAAAYDLNQWATWLQSPRDRVLHPVS